MELEEQHPIPQQISAYQFRLVGDMTIKQFFQVAGGAIVALLIYSSNAPSYIKWPLIIASFLTGIAFAFFPLQDRPLSTWIILFIKSIYSPTLYVWKKGVKRQYYFMPEPETLEAQKPVIPEGFTTATPELKKFDEKESAFLTNVTQEFVSTKPITPQKPIRVAQGLKVPSTPQISVEKTQKESLVGQATSRDLSQTAPATPAPIATQKMGEAKVAQFSKDAAPPNPPTKPNIIVGQVIDPNGSIIEGAILEIRDSEGRPVRALKSNKLGHFMIVTPLLSGKYQIVTEKEGYEFDPITIEVKGEIIPPIAVWSKKQLEKVYP